MNDLVKERTPQIIAAEINNYKESTGRIQLSCAVEIGRRLMEAKALLPHGEWGKWLQEYVSYSQLTAERYIKVAREYGQTRGGSPGEEKAKSSTLKILEKREKRCRRLWIKPLATPLSKDSIGGFSIAILILMLTL